jgi:DNA-binding NarL/FixJ family response regulator
MKGKTAAKAARSRTPARHRILLVDDHPITRQGLAALINLETDLEVCGEAENVGDALVLIERVKPALVVVDLSLPGRGGLDLIKDLAVQQPGLPALVLSMHDEALHAERVLRAGARGYLMKAAGGRAVMEAIRTVLGGGIYVSAAVNARILAGLSAGKSREADSFVGRLSDREFEIFQLIGQGLGTREIAGRLNLSIKTVEAHRANLKSKLDLRDAPALVREAVRWVESQANV